MEPLKKLQSWVTISWFQNAIFFVFVFFNSSIHLFRYWRVCFGNFQVRLGNARLYQFIRWIQMWERAL